LVRSKLNIESVMILFPVVVPILKQFRPGVLSLTIAGTGSRQHRRHLEAVTPITRQKSATVHRPSGMLLEQSNG
jgi:hypothetical protein